MSNVLTLPAHQRGELIQIAEGYFVATHLSADKWGNYVVAYPYAGQASECSINKAEQDHEAAKVPAVEQPSHILADICAKALADHFALPELKRLGLEWHPGRHLWWRRYRESDYSEAMRENEVLRAQVVRLEIELGRRPQPKSAPVVALKGNE